MKNASNLKSIGRSSVLKKEEIFNCIRNRV